MKITVSYELSEISGFFISIMVVFTTIMLPFLCHCALAESAYILNHTGAREMLKNLIVIPGNG